MGFEVTMAREEDVGELVRLSAALFREDAGTRDALTDVRWPEEHGRDHFRSLVARGDAVCFLALRGGRPVGYLAGLVRDPAPVRPVKVAELQSMFVERGSRGLGLGSRLVGRFVAWARGRSAERVSVTANASNAGAIRFYGRHGFRPRSEVLERAP